MIILIIIVLRSSFYAQNLHLLEKMSTITTPPSKYISAGLRPLTDTDLQRCIEENLDTVDDQSCGCFVLSPNDTVLMIRPIINGQAADYWAFPKGHPDEGERAAAAATRETLEETHVQISSIHTDISTTIGYSFIKKMHTDQWKKHPAYPDENVRPILCYHKRVTYFFAQVDVEQPVSKTNETADVKWVPFKDVMAKLSHIEEKQVTCFFLGVRSAGISGIKLGSNQCASSNKRRK